MEHYLPHAIMVLHRATFVRFWRRRRRRRRRKLGNRKG
jgi:hypothetical protein